MLLYATAAQKILFQVRLTAYPPPPPAQAQGRLLERTVLKAIKKVLSLPLLTDLIGSIEV